MIVSFTGTRRGMVRPQFNNVEQLVERLKLEVGVHGCADGADRQFHLITTGSPRHLYPCNEEQHRWAFENCVGGKDVVHPILPPLVRNNLMIDKSEATVAAPSGFREVMRGSGTWQSIRYAREVGQYLFICWPDGRVTEENKPSKG